RFRKTRQGIIAIFFVLEGEGARVVDFLHGFQESRQVDDAATDFDGSAFSFALIYILQMAIVDAIFVSGGQYNGILLDAHNVANVDANAYACVEVFDLVVDVVNT